MYYIIIDTGFWIAYLFPQENPQLSIEANKMFTDLENQTIVIPYPTLYEFINSKLSRKKNAASRDLFERIIKTKKIEFISDESYKNMALDNFFIKSKAEISDISLVDEIIKLIIKDPTHRIDYIATFDEVLKNYALSNGVYSL